MAAFQDSTDTYTAWFWATSHIYRCLLQVVPQHGVSTQSVATDCSAKRTPRLAWHLVRLIPQTATRSEEGGTHKSSSTSFLNAFRAMHWKAASTLMSSLALVSKWGMLPLLAHHCLAFFSDTCAQARRHTWCNQVVVLTRIRASQHTKATQPSSTSVVTSQHHGMHGCVMDIHSMRIHQTDT